MSILSSLSCTHKQSFQKQLQWLWDKCSTCFNSGHGKASGITILVLNNRLNVIFNGTGCSDYIPHFLCFSVHKLWFPVKSVRTDDAVFLKVTIFGQPLFLQWFCIRNVPEGISSYVVHYMTLIQCLARTLPFCLWDQQHLFFIIRFQILCYLYKSLLTNRISWPFVTGSDPLGSPVKIWGIAFPIHKFMLQSWC